MLNEEAELDILNVHLKSLRAGLKHAVCAILVLGEEMGIDYNTMNERAELLFDKVLKEEPEDENG